MPKRPRVPHPVLLSTLLTLGAIVVVLTFAVQVHPGPIGPDASLLRWFIDHRSGAATAFAKVISELGGTATMTVLGVAACSALAWRRQWETAVFVGFTALGSGALVFFGKLLIGRPRPPLIDRMVVETNYSYPSGHALGSAVVVGVVVAAVLLPLLRGVWRMLLVAVTVLFLLGVGVSRLYLGVHWPTDIVAGWIFGVLWLGLCFSFRPVLAEHAHAMLTKVTPD
ncbi:phosphatase PAP2 family protein [Nocardia acidivorans]|uniref:phosphatase PAP2 family protein n=1 Tax=Nocardia acidivorans TaxID=404580 RepID=UPI00083358BA|nr:phosphatase PAP2 family protein [Nocardia acidivorans]